MNFEGEQTVMADSKRPLGIAQSATIFPKYLINRSSQPKDSVRDFTVLTKTSATPIGKNASRPFTLSQARFTPQQAEMLTKKPLSLISVASPTRNEMAPTNSEKASPLKGLSSPAEKFERAKQAFIRIHARLERALKKLKVLSAGNEEEEEYLKLVTEKEEYNGVFEQMAKLEAVEGDDDATLRFIRKIFKAGSLVKELLRKSKEQHERIKSQNEKKSSFVAAEDNKDKSPSVMGEIQDWEEVGPGRGSSLKAPQYNTPTFDLTPKRALSGQSTTVTPTTICPMKLFTPVSDAEQIIKEEQSEYRNSRLTIEKGQNNSHQSTSQFVKRKSGELLNKFIKAMQLGSLLKEETSAWSEELHFNVENKSKSTCHLIREYVSGFQTHDKEIEIWQSQFGELKKDPTFVRIMESVEVIGSQSYSYERGKLELKSWDQLRMNKIVEALNHYRTMEREQEYKYKLSQREATMLLNLGTQKLGPISLSNVITLSSKEGGASSYLLFKSPSAKEAESRASIREMMEELSEQKLFLSSQVKWLLKLPDQEKGRLSYLQQVELLQNCSIVEEHNSSEEDGLFFLDKEESKLNEEICLKLKMENASYYSEIIRVIGNKKQRVKQATQLIKKKVARFEESKKFIQIRDKPVQNKARLMIGPKHDKTEFIMTLERRLGVVIYFSESERHSGIMLYGEEEALKLAYLELGSSLKLHTLVKVSHPVTSSLAGLLTKERRAKITQQLKTEFKLSHLELYVSISLITKKNEALFYVPKHLERNAVHALGAVVSSCEQKVRYEVLSPAYYPISQKVKEICFHLKEKSLFNFNGREYPQLFSVPNFVHTWHWLYSKEEGESGTNGGPLARYPEEKAAILESYYQKNQDFFLLGSSNFSLGKGREEHWSEQTEDKRYKVKRVKMQQIDHQSSSLQALPSHCLLLRAFPKDMAAVKKALKNELEQENQESLQVSLSQTMSLETMKNIEKELEVKVRIQGQKAVIIGSRRKEAFQRISKLQEIQASQEALPGPALEDLHSCKEEFKQVVAHFQSSVLGQYEVEIEKVEKINNPDKEREFKKAKDLLRYTSLCRESEEKLLYQGLPPRNLGQFENPERVRGNIFASSPLFFKKEGATGKLKILVVKAVLGTTQFTTDDLALLEVPPKIDGSSNNSAKQESKLVVQEYDPEEDFNSIFRKKEEVKQQEHENKGSESKEYFDSVRFEREGREGFAIFHRDFVLPAYVVTYSLEQKSTYRRGNVSRSGYSGMAASFSSFYSNK